MTWFRDWLLVTGLCNITLFFSQKLMTTWKQKMNAETQTQSGGKPVDWVNSQIQKEEQGWGGKKALLVFGMCWMAWFIHGTGRHHSFGGALTGWWGLRHLFYLPKLQTSWEKPGSSYYTNTDKPQSIKSCLYVCREGEDTKAWIIRTQTCHIRLSFPRCILNAHFTFKIPMIDKCVKELSHCNINSL